GIRDFHVTGVQTCALPIWPIDLERYGFLESLRRYAQAFAEQAGFRVQLSLPQSVGLSQASELVLFRVLQEALTNAAKHARPTRRSAERRVGNAWRPRAATA